ncbi:MAG: ABC transporter permease [Planctomycetota bacterium]
MSTGNEKTRELWNRFGPFLGLLFVSAVFASLRWQTFTSWVNIEIMLVNTTVVATAAFGMTIIIISGGIDLSVGSTIALGTVVVALLINAGWTPGAAALGGIGAATLAGLIIGLLVTRLKLTPFIVTLGMMGVLRGAAKGLSDQKMVRTEDTWLNELLSLSGESGRLLPIGVWITLAAGLLTAGLLRYTRFGRHVYAIGSNESTARLCGVRVDWNRIVIYALGAAFAGIASVMQFSYVRSGDPTTAVGKELDVIAAVVIGGGSLSGGEGTILGSLIGALIMTVVDNGCTKLGLEDWVQDIVTGGIIVLAVTLDRLRHRSRS